MKKERKTSRSTLVNKLDRIFSKYIRLRDAFPNGTFRCISCGQIKPLAMADAGHFFSRTHMSTRFDEDNVHAECSYCNRFSSDHIIGYRDRLLAKIGAERLAYLETKAHDTRKWSLFELEQMIKYYEARVEILKRQKGIEI